MLYKTEIGFCWSYGASFFLFFLAFLGAASVGAASSTITDHHHSCRLHTHLCIRNGQLPHNSLLFGFQRYEDAAKLVTTTMTTTTVATMTETGNGTGVDADQTKAINTMNAANEIPRKRFISSPKQVIWCGLHLFCRQHAYPTRDSHRSRETETNSSLVSRRNNP